MRNRSTHIFPLVPIIVGILVGLSLGWKTQAQAPQHRELNLQEALQRAHATWPALKVDSLNILAAQRERKAHPMLDAAQFNSEWGQINSVYRDQGLQINQTFRLPAVYKAQGQLAQARLEGARIEQARSLQQLERDLISTYYAFLVLLQKRTLLQHNDSLLFETVRVLQQRYQRGQISGSDLNQILLIQGESSINVQKVDLELEHTLHWFQYLTASDRTPSVVDSILWTSGLGQPIDSISSPDLDLLANLSQEAKANSELSRQLRKPGWSIGLRNMSIQGMGPDGVLYPLSRRFNTFQMGLVLPLWGKPLREQAKADRFRWEAMHLNQQQGIGRWNALQDKAHREVRSLQDRWVKFNTSLIPLANQLTDQANAQLASGELDLIQWTHTLQRILQTRESYLQLAMDFNNALIRQRYPALNP
jgi:cobalt-zinc-cadmium resistance protein CzcA